MLTEPRGHVVKPGCEMAYGRLARSRRADQGDELAWLGDEGDVEEDLLAAGALEDGDGLERGERNLVRAGVTEVDVVEADLGRPALDVNRSLFVVDHGWQVEDLEDPVERDKCGHHVHLHVGQCRERAVEPCEVKGQRDKSPH